MSSDAYKVFERLVAQVAEVRSAAERELLAGHISTGPVLLRSAMVLTVAAFDSYIHERSVALLYAHSQTGPSEATAVASYLKGVTDTDVSSAQGERFIRWRLSYKTLVAPDKVDEVLTAAGVDATRTWLLASTAIGSRPDRVRALVQLQYDRRNQIAHEGDWDPVALGFRSLEAPHLDDCVNNLTSLVTQLDALL